MTAQFITFEGMEGAGKSTCIQFACDVLTENNVPFVLTREPGGTPLAEQMRSLLLHQESESVTAAAELLLMFAARSQHLEHVIKPALRDGKWVICDRFTDATYAYQGGGRGADYLDIAHLEQLVQGDLRPDMTLILDVSYEVGMERVGNRGEKDRFEKESKDFFERVREAYHLRAKAMPERYRIIDASAELSNVVDIVRACIDDRLGVQ